MPREHLSATIINLVSVEWFLKHPPEERNGFPDATLLLHSLCCSLMNSGTKDVLPAPPSPPPGPTEAAHLLNIYQN